MITDTHRLRVRMNCGYCRGIYEKMKKEKGSSCENENIKKNDRKKKT